MLFRSKSTSDDFTSSMDALGRATIEISVGSSEYRVSKAEEVNRLALLRIVALLKILLDVAMPTFAEVFIPCLMKSFKYLVSSLLPDATYLKSFLRFSLCGFGSIVSYQFGVHSSQQFTPNTELRTPDQIVNLARPLAILLLITFLPPTVSFLARNPCFLCLFNFFGWYTLFGMSVVY